jgi:hypothetical protein
MSAPDRKTEILRLANGVSVRVTARRQARAADEPILLPHLGEYRIYDAVVYDILTSDHARNRLYERAIARYAPGAVALDIGTGRDVNWARACVAAGARMVYAVEELGDSFHAARATIERLGLQGKVRLLEGNSSTITLPEKVDLCVSEIIGGIGSAEGAPAILRDARLRLMAPGGKMIPERCLVNIAAAQLPDDIHRSPALSYGWATYLDQVFDRIGHPFDVKVHIANFPGRCVLSSEDVFEDFRFIENIPVTSRRLANLRVVRAGRLDGFVTRNLLWCLEDDVPLDAFHDGGSFNPSPFFPVFYPGVSVEEGDEIDVLCESAPSDDGVLPDYRLTGELRRGAGVTQFSYEAPHHEPRFRTTPFYQTLFSGMAEPRRYDTSKERL